MLKKNEGPIDRSIRIVAGLTIALLAYTSLSGTAQLIAYILSVILIITGAIGFCGLYTLFGINTCPVKKTQK